jgi:mono/diheme cytochrome c family protein
MRIGGVALVIVAAAAGVSGCNLADSGTNMVNGKQLFVDNCGSCHVLSRAGTGGTAGPNLDEAFQRARKDGFGESTFEGLVLAQIQNPNKNPSFNPVTNRPEATMPADIVTGEDAEDVAAYVASAAGKAGEDSGQLAQLGAAQAEGTAEAADGVLEMPATGATNYEFADAIAPPGPLTIRSPNESPTEHNIALEGGGVNEEGPVVGEGDVSEIEVDLDAGEYQFFCSVPGHREGGMEGTLTVE